jgi:hypothetical protein
MAFSTPVESKGKSLLSVLSRERRGELFTKNSTNLPGIETTTAKEIMNANIIQHLTYSTDFLPLRNNNICLY